MGKNMGSMLKGILGRRRKVALKGCYAVSRIAARSTWESASALASDTVVAVADAEASSVASSAGSVAVTEMVGAVPTNACGTAVQASDRKARQPSSSAAASTVSVPATMWATCIATAAVPRFGEIAAVGADAAGEA